MEDGHRPMRADAERNRRRLIEAAAEMFAEHGVEVGVAEIAQRAGVGRGTLFRHFPSKEALVTAVMAQRIRESVAIGRERLAEPDAGAALFGLIDDALERMQTDRALVETLADTWMVHPEVRAAHGQALAMIEELVVGAQRAGAVRDDVSAVDVLLLIKGVCESARAFQNIDPAIARRQVDLVKSAISAGGGVPLRGTPPTTADLERAECAVSGDLATTASRAGGH